jgi:hypothetical protein
MAALKLLVIVMGALIVVGVGVLIYGLAARLDPPRAGYGDAKIALPVGAQVVGMTAAGDRLVLRLALPDTTERLLVLDIARGRQIGTLELVHP